jgi:hypothetical protein
MAGALILPVEELAHRSHDDVIAAGCISRDDDDRVPS